MHIAHELLLNKMLRLQFPMLQFPTLQVTKLYPVRSKQKLWCDGKHKE